MVSTIVKGRRGDSIILFIEQEDVTVKSTVLRRLRSHIGSDHFSFGNVLAWDIDDKPMSPCARMSAFRRGIRIYLHQSIESILVVRRPTHIRFHVVQIGSTKDIPILHISLGERYLHFYGRHEFIYYIGKHLMALESVGSSFVLMAVSCRSSRMCLSVSRIEGEWRKCKLVETVLRELG